MTAERRRPGGRRPSRGRSSRRASGAVTASAAASAFPYRAPTVPRGVEVPPRAARSAPTTTPTGPARPPARVARGADRRRPAAARSCRRWPTRDRRPRPPGRPRAAPTRRRAPAPVDLRRQPPQPPRHAAAAHVDPRAVAPPARRRRGRRLLLRQPRHRRTLSALVARRHPDRPHRGRPAARPTWPRELIDDGWSLLIFPEGGRSPDGWGQPFRGGAAYLSIRAACRSCRCTSTAPARSCGKGMKRPKPGRTTVTFGAPLRPAEGEDARRFGDRIEQAVAELGRRGRHRLVVGPPAGRRGHDPVAHGPRLHRLAPGLGPHRAPGPGQGRPAPSPAARLAGMSHRPAGFSASCVSHVRRNTPRTAGYHSRRASSLARRASRAATRASSSAIRSVRGMAAEPLVAARASSGTASSATS